MAAFYIDNDVGADLAPALAALGHEATLTSALGLEEGSDGRQLLTAAEHGWVLLTHNGRDFTVLQDAWRYWTAIWRLGVDHAGILVLSRSVHGRTWPAAHAASRWTSWFDPISSQPACSSAGREPMACGNEGRESRRTTIQAVWASSTKR